MQIADLKTLTLKTRGVNVPRGLDRDILWISLVYTLAHGLMLLNRGIYWDDWVLYMMDRETLAQFLPQAGTPILAYYYSFLFSFNDSILIIRVIVFSSYLISALLLNEILKTVSEIDGTSRLVLVLIFAVFPAMAAREIVSVSYYGVSCLMFMFAAWLTARYLRTRTPILRVMILSIFFIAFFVNTFVFFYVLLLSYILYQENRSASRAAAARNICLKYPDFLVLPVAFWAVRYLFFLPYGLYADYNVLSITNLYPQTLARGLATSFYESFVFLLLYCLSLLFGRVILSPLLAPTFVVSLAVLYAILRKTDVPSRDVKRALKMFLVGCCIYAVGVFPYLAVGKMPVPFSLESRHELLVPFGASFIICYGLSLVPRRLLFSHTFARKLLLCALLALFVTANVAIHLDFQRDSFKQQSLIHSIQSSQTMRGATTFLFIDHTISLNALARDYNFYEYTSIMKYTFGDETRFGCSASEVGQISYYLTKYSLYSFRDYRERQPWYVVSIYGGDYALDDGNLGRLIFYGLVDPQNSTSLVERIVTIRCDALPAYGNGSVSGPC